MDNGFYRVVNTKIPALNFHIIEKADDGICEIEMEGWDNDYTDYLHPHLIRKYSHRHKSIENYLASHPSFSWGTPDYITKRINKVPGEFHPRIYRPTLIKRKDFIAKYALNYSSIVLSTDHYIEYSDYSKQFIISLQHLSTLKERLTAVFNTIYPAGDNIKSYGHEIRNILILACTEVEAQLKGILRANGYELNTAKADKKFEFSMNHYFKLFDILKLKRYSIDLPYYSELIKIKPFAEWALLPSPTDSLPWYKAYNDIKHDNELKFPEAKLTHAINAVCAVYVLLLAQYGSKIPFGTDLLGSFFQVRNSPTFSIEELYLPPLKDCNWMAVNYAI